MFSKFKIWFRKKIYCKHDFDLYIYYDKTNFIYKCLKCDKEIYIDQEDNTRLDFEEDIEKAKKVWREFCKVNDDSMFLFKTRRYKMVTKDPETWKKFVDKLKKDN